MFGMGTTLCVADFVRVLKVPRPVLIGVCLQYLIMPLSGFLLASVMNVEAEIAAGVILIGACPRWRWPKMIFNRVLARRTNVPRFWESSRSLARPVFRRSGRVGRSTGT